MDKVLDVIAQADGKNIEILLHAVLRRYAELFPEWEVRTISLEKHKNQVEQLDRIIAALEKLKQEQYTE